MQHDLKLGLLPDFGSLVHEAESLMQNHLFKEFEAAVLSVQKQWSSGASLSESSGGTDESPARRQTHELLINMLLDRKNHALLCRLLIADPNTIEIVSELLLLDDEDPLIDLFRFVVQEEISRTADSNTLFREQSLAVQLFGELVKRPPVRRWLVSVLRKPVLRAGIAMGGPIKTAASVLSALCKKAFLIPPVLSRGKDWLVLFLFGFYWMCLVWFGFGLVWFWFGLVWFGFGLVFLVWFGLVWFGLVWFVFVFVLFLFLFLFLF